MIKICPSYIFYSEVEEPKLSDNTWKDLVDYTRQLKDTFYQLALDRKAVEDFCSE